MNLFTRGNTKIHKNTLIYNMSSGLNCPADIRGLCSYGVRNGNSTCYCIKAERMYPHVRAHLQRQQQTWITEPAELFINRIKDIYKVAIKKPRYLRLNVSGDFHSFADIIKLDTIARKVKDIVTVYTYTHRYDLLYNIQQSDIAFVLNVSDKQVSDFNTFQAVLKPTSKLVCTAGKHECMKICTLCAKHHGKTVQIKYH